MSHTIDFGKVAVLMGGHSMEREISLKSGENVYAALIRQGIKAQKIDTAHQPVQALLNGQFDRAIVVLHGPKDEDGTILGLLETLNIPYTGSGILASALAMDKIKTKAIWQAEALPVLPKVVVNDQQSLVRAAHKVGFPLAVKPNHQGSSLGISCVREEHELQKAFLEAKKYENEVFLEPWIDGKEFTVGILAEKALPAIYIKPSRPYYDYMAKYQAANTTSFIIPSGLTDTQELEVKNLALKAFHALGCSGWGRVDFMQDATGKFWLLEVNIVPGFTETSLVPLAAKANGMDFDAFVIEVLKTSLSNLLSKETQNA